jgi:hypothetical protein
MGDRPPLTSRKEPTRDAAAKTEPPVYHPLAEFDPTDQVVADAFLPGGRAKIDRRQGGQVAVLQGESALFADLFGDISCSGGSPSAEAGTFSTGPSPERPVPEPNPAASRKRSDVDFRLILLAINLICLLAIGVILYFVLRY